MNQAVRQHVHTHSMNFLYTAPDWQDLRREYFPLPRIFY